MILCFKGSEVLVWLLLVGLTQACIRTSTYYRSQYRSQTHVFVPEEYRPMRPERSLEASGPLETQDFLTSIPTTRLVRVEGPNLQFASEEARWMTKVSNLYNVCEYVLTIHKDNNQIFLTSLLCKGHQKLF